MPRSNDDWERLVAAVLRREEIWQLCHAPSRSVSSISSSFSPGSSSRFDEDLILTVAEVPKTATQIEHVWVVEYQPEVFVTRAFRGDGTEEVKQVLFSRSTFNEIQAKQWWSDNIEKVKHKYGTLAPTIHLLSVALSNTTLEHHMNTDACSDWEHHIKPINPVKQYLTCSDWFEQYVPGVFINIAALQDRSRKIQLIRFSRIQFNEQEAQAWWSQNQEKVLERYSRPPPSGTNRQILSKEPILEFNFNEVLSYANLDLPQEGLYGTTVKIFGMHERIKRYRPGVYVTLVYNDDGRRDVERVRFSKNNFEQHEALAWWENNQENVYKKYHASAGLARIKCLQDLAIITDRNKTSSKPEERQATKTHI